MAPAINNVLSTGGGTPGIKQATLISGVGVSVPGGVGGAPGGGSGSATVANNLSSAGLSSMTVNVNGNGSGTTNSPGQPGQNQTIVLSKGAGQSTGGMTVAMASTGSVGSNQNPQGGAATPQPPGGAPHQGIAIGIGTGSGVQIVNMNSLNAVRSTAASVNVGAVNVTGGSPQVATVGPAGARNVGPRMIITPQMLANARPGQPGVEECNSEISELILQSDKSSPINFGIGCEVEFSKMDRVDLVKEPDIRSANLEDTMEQDMLSTSPSFPSPPSKLTEHISIHPPDLSNYSCSSSNVSSSNNSVTSVDAREPILSVVELNSPPVSESIVQNTDVCNFEGDNRNMTGDTGKEERMGVAPQESVIVSPLRSLPKTPKDDSKSCDGSSEIVNSETQASSVQEVSQKMESEVSVDSAFPSVGSLEIEIPEKMSTEIEKSANEDVAFVPMGSELSLQNNDRDSHSVEILETDNEDNTTSIFQETSADNFSDLIFPVETFGEKQDEGYPVVFNRKNHFPVIMKSTVYDSFDHSKPTASSQSSPVQSSVRMLNNECEVTESRQSYLEDSQKTICSSQVAARIHPIQQKDNFSCTAEGLVPQDKPMSMSSRVPTLSTADEPSKYQANNPNMFTNDPQLHSQFLQFTQSNPVLSSKSVPNSPQSPVVKSIDPRQSSENFPFYGQHHSKDIPSYRPIGVGSSGTTVYSSGQQYMPSSNTNHPLPQIQDHSSRPTNFNFPSTKSGRPPGHGEFIPNPSNSFQSSSCSYSQNVSARPIQHNIRSSYSESRSQPINEYVPSGSNIYAQQYAHQNSNTIRPGPPAPTCHTQQPPSRWMSIAPSANETLDTSQTSTPRSSAFYSTQVTGRGATTGNVNRNINYRPHNPRNTEPSMVHSRGYRTNQSHENFPSPYAVRPHSQLESSLPQLQQQRSMNRTVPSNFTYRPCQYEFRPPNPQGSETIHPGASHSNIKLGTQKDMSGPPISPIASQGPPWSGGAPQSQSVNSEYHPSFSSQSTMQSTPPSQQYYPYNQPKPPNSANFSDNMSMPGPSSQPGGSYPVICRVSPLRFRYDQSSINEGVARYPQVLSSTEVANNGSNKSNENSSSVKSVGNIVYTSRASNNPMHSVPLHPTSPNNPQRYPYGPTSYPKEYPPPAPSQHRPGPFESEDFSGGYNKSTPGHLYGSSSASSQRQQYHGMMRGYRPQITLQALPGLPPGAQGHHLLVKTENGQYQLLRVGMPAPAPTAATGTPTVVPPNNNVSTTTTSMSIAQQLPNNSPMTTTSVLNSNSNHVVVSTSLSSLPPNLSSVITSASSGSNSNSSQVLGTVLSSTSGNLTNSMTTTLPTHQQSMSTLSQSTTPVGIITAPGTPSSSNNNPPKPGVGASNLSSSSVPNNPTSPATYRLQSTTTTIPSNAVNSSVSGVGMTASMSIQQQQMYPPQLPQPHVPPFVSNTANTVSQMTPDTAKVKCRNFLSFLLELSAKQNAQVARNVKGLIQGLVDGKVNEVDFSDRLQKEVNSQPQPCLVGFLKKSLPHLRHSLATNEFKIEGIRPPPMSSVVSSGSLPSTPVTALIPQNQVRPHVPTGSTTPVRIITPIHTVSQSMSSSSLTTLQTPSSTPRVPGPAATHQKITATKSTASKSKPTSSTSTSNMTSPSSTSSKSSASSSKSGAKDKEKKSFSASGYSGDDDINDVAAMGGVNLAEESQKILGSTEFVGTQIRSVRDETFLHPVPLSAKMKAIAAKYGLEEPSAEVAAMISHATEERLKNLLEKLAVIAEHRLDVIKMDDRYEVTQDVKGQLRFLEELEKLERKRHDEQEREMLIRAAKSRSKSEDPEQAKLKAKAKEMQRVAMEETRQREANQTALLAIGPRKKPKLDLQPGSQSTISQSSGGVGTSSSMNRPQMGLRPRLKRVNIRDLLFLLEQEKDTTRSQFLYKHLLSK